MQRILTILILAILLLPSPPVGKPAAVKAGALLVTVRSLPLVPAEPDRRWAGALLYQGAWEVRSDNPGFGGISALLATPHGDMLGLSDSGLLMGFHVGDQPAQRRPFIAPLPVRSEEAELPWWSWDSESLTHDPATDRYWVGFELLQRICRYSPGFARVEACRTWPEIWAWPKTGSVESLARLPDGRFLAIGEMGMTSDGRHDTLLFAGDPADQDTPPPIHLRYRAPQGYRPTDAVALDSRHLLVLNRRLTLQELFTGVVAIVDLPEHFEPDMELKARTLARLAPPILSDNYEGLSITREGDRTMIWVISDDNHEFFERTLLLKFLLPLHP